MSAKKRYVLTWEFELEDSERDSDARRFYDAIVRTNDTVSPDQFRIILSEKMPSGERHIAGDQVPGIHGIR